MKICMGYYWPLHKIHTIIILLFTIQVMPVELPGRNTRLREDKPRCMRQLVKDIVDALEPFLKYVYLAFYTNKHPFIRSIYLFSIEKLEINLFAKI